MGFSNGYTSKTYLPSSSRHNPLCWTPDICGLHILMFTVEMRHLCNNNNNNKLMIHTLFYEGTVFTTVNQSLFN